MTVPYTFANSTGFIPLSELDANFAAIPQYANTAGNITGNIQSNITSLGVLNSLSVTGNIDGNFFVGNGSALTGITVSEVPATALTGNTLNSSVTFSSLTRVGILANLSVTGNISASYITATLFGSALFANVANSVAGANVTGNVANATYAATAGSANTANTATTAGTVTTNAQPNITSTGILTSVSATGNITGSYIIGNGSQLTGLPASYSNANVAAYLPTYSGNIAAGNVSVTGAVTAYSFIGNGAALTGITVNYSNANVASYLTTYSGNLSAGNVDVSSAVTANGNVTGGNIVTAGRVSATGNITGNYIIGNGAFITGLPIGNYSNANVANYLPVFSGNVAAGNVLAGNAVTGATLSATGNITGTNVNATAVRVVGTVSATGNITGNFFIGNGSQLTGVTANYGNSNVAAYLPTYTGNLAGASLSLTGNVRTLGAVSATGNVQGNYVLGNGALLTGIGSANYSNANVASYLPINTANVTGGNVLTDNYCYANGVPVTGLGANVSGNSVTYVAPFNGAYTLTGTDKWSQFVSVLDFGADPTGSTDSRNSFQAALNTGKHVYIPTGDYRIDERLLCTVAGQMMSGDGRAVSRLIIESTFNLSATGVIDCAGVQEAPTFRDFGIKFIQPDTSNRASLIAYPPAFYAVDAPRFTVQNMLITGAMTGINLSGNSGGAFIDILEMSAFVNGIYIDGSADTIRIDKFHFFPFLLTANQQNIFYGAGTMALNVGRVDGLFLTEFLNISNLGLTMFQGTSGPPQVFIENSAFDTWNGIVQNAGRLHVTNSYITVYPQNNVNGYIMSGTDAWSLFSNCWFQAGSTNQSMILMQNCSGCSVSITNSAFRSPVSGYPYIYTASTCLNNSSLQVSDSTFAIGTTNSYVINAITPSVNTMMLHFVNNIVQTTPNAVYSQPMFRIGNRYRVYMTGNRGVDKGTNSQSFITITGDEWSWVSGNIGPGWTMSFPVAVNGYYANNLRS